MSLILFAEDERRIQDIVADYLKKDGHEVLLADDGMEALMMIKNNAVDLMILDIMMPDMDGFSVCRQVREMSNLPVIMLTAKQKEADKLRGYELGADDYVTKPFSPNVLMAKVRALLKRTGGINDASTLQAGKITLNTASREVMADDKQPII